MVRGGWGKYHAIPRRAQQCQQLPRHIGTPSVLTSYFRVQSTPSSLAHPFNQLGLPPAPARTKGTARAAPRFRKAMLLGQSISAVPGFWGAERG
jgi:hypothetical protein